MELKGGLLVDSLERKESLWPMTEKMRRQAGS